MWDRVSRILEEYFDRGDFQFEIKTGEDPGDTECFGTLKMAGGMRQKKVRMYLETEANVHYIRVISPIVTVERCTKSQLARLMEQNVSWVGTTVGVLNKDVVFTTLVRKQEFDADAVVLGDAINWLTNRADQMEVLLFGREHSRKNARS